MAFAGLLLLGLATAGSTVVIFDAVAGRTSGVVAGTTALAAFGAFWVVVPVWMRVSRR
jgi:succinate-acetate transporter protein